MAASERLMPTQHPLPVGAPTYAQAVVATDAARTSIVFITRSGGNARAVRVATSAPHEVPRIALSRACPVRARKVSAAAPIRTPRGWDIGADDGSE